MTVTLPRAVDDLHLHCRDGADVLADVLALMMTREHTPADPSPIARALLMPNLQPPVTTGALASAYKKRVLDALQHLNERRLAADTAARGADAARASPLAPLQFEPLMSIYLTDATSAEDIADAKKHGVVAAKLYPQGATTHSVSREQKRGCLCTRVSVSSLSL